MTIDLLLLLLIASLMAIELLLAGKLIYRRNNDFRKALLARELSERNKLIKSLQQEQERFHAIARSSGDWIWEVDTEGKYVYSNQVVKEILGYTSEEILGTNCIDLMRETEREEGKRLFVDHARVEQQFSMTKECLRKDGQFSILESNISTKYGPEGNFLGFLGVDRDITRRKKAEEEVSKSKNYLVTVLNAVLSGVVIIDANTHEIMDANITALRMMGVSREEAMGKVCHKFMCPAEKGKCPITDLGLTVDRSEKLLLTSKGSPTPILKSVERIESNGRFLLVENFVDITERKQMEERLLKSERLAAIGELATMVAHDLRNPLQGIATAVYSAKKITQSAGNEKMNIVLKLIDDSVRCSDKIIRDLLDFSVADLKLEISETNPNTLVNKALSGIPLPRGIELIDRTQKEPRIYVDCDKMIRVITNLVINAFDAMTLGGTLTILSREENGNLSLSITDTGKGIPKEKMNKLWTPFVTTKARGMGLGLPICKRIIEAHRGQILVQTESGKGTTFTILVPITLFLQSQVRV